MEGHDRHEQPVHITIDLNAFEHRLDAIDRHLQTINNNIGALMSALQDQVTRVAAAFTALSELVDRALANDASQTAENDALRAERDTLLADAATATAGLANIAPDPAEPPVEPPVI